MNHMPSHTWNQLGRWGDSVRANIKAWHSDQQAAVGEAFAIYPSHNLQMLLFAASMDGQGAIAIQAAKDYAKLTGSNVYRILTLIRFGRFDEVLEFTQRPSENSEAAVWDFGQGYAELRTGQQAPVREHLQRLLDAANQSSGMFRFNSAHNVLGVLGGILEGEVERSKANLDQAITSFTRAVTFEDAMIYDEPEALPFSARHWLGAALLEAKRYPDAERVYREELKKHPHNGWSLFGLKASLEAQHKPAQDISQDLDASWARSDTWLHRSAF
jgi:tetratricopeptide (TPR) repeat protein